MLDFFIYALMFWVFFVFVRVWIYVLSAHGTDLKHFLVKVLFLAVTGWVALELLTGVKARLAEVLWRIDILVGKTVNFKRLIGDVLIPAREIEKIVVSYHKESRPGIFFPKVDVMGDDTSFQVSFYARRHIYMIVDFRLKDVFGFVDYRINARKMAGLVEQVRKMNPRVEFRDGYKVFGPKALGKSGSGEKP